MTYEDFCHKMVTFDFFQLIDDEQKAAILEKAENLAENERIEIFRFFQQRDDLYRAEKEGHLKNALKVSDEVTSLVYEGKHMAQKSKIAESRKTSSEEDEAALLDIEEKLNQ